MVADDYSLLHSFFIINAGDADMSEEKIVFPFNFKPLLFKPFALLFFKNQGAAICVLGISGLRTYSNNKVTRVLTLPTLDHKANIFLLPFIVFISNKAFSKNNLEVEH